MNRKTESIFVRCVYSTLMCLNRFFFIALELSLPYAAPWVPNWRPLDSSYEKRTSQGTRNKAISYVAVENIVPIPR